jgi:hypothetical protein
LPISTAHAGIGLYDLQGDQASRTGEYLEGIARLWDQPDLPALTADYMKVLHDMNPDGQLRYYPGSPELARRLTRPQDRLMLNEKHPEDGVLLKDNMTGDRRVKVHLGEGWHVPRAMLPVQEKRAVMLIDPPFEQLDEMQTLCGVAERSDWPDAPNRGGDLVPGEGSARVAAFLSGPGRHRRAEIAAGGAAGASAGYAEQSERLRDGDCQSAVGAGRGIA